MLATASTATTHHQRRLLIEMPANRSHFVSSFESKTTARLNGDYSSPTATIRRSAELLDARLPDDERLSAAPLSCAAYLTSLSVPLLDEPVCAAT